MGNSPSQSRLVSPNARVQFLWIPYPAGSGHQNVTLTDSGLYLTPGIVPILCKV